MATVRTAMQQDQPRSAQRRPAHLLLEGVLARLPVRAGPQLGLAAQAWPPGLPIPGLMAPLPLPLPLPGPAALPATPAVATSGHEMADLRPPAADTFSADAGDGSPPDGKVLLSPTAAAAYLLPEAPPNGLPLPPLPPLPLLPLPCWAPGLLAAGTNGSPHCPADSLEGEAAGEAAPLPAPHISAIRQADCSSRLALSPSSPTSAPRPEPWLVLARLSCCRALSVARRSRRLGLSASCRPAASSPLRSRPAGGRQGRGEVRQVVCGGRWCC
jgi:hypothetical protein